MSEVAEKQYKFTFEQCESMISGVCSRCGGQLKPLETVDNSGNPTFWAGCETCEVFDWGVSEEVHAIAKAMVEKYHHVQYSHIVRPLYNAPQSDIDYYNRSQIGGTSTLVAQILRIQSRFKEGKEL